MIIEVNSQSSAGQSSSGELQLGKVANVGTNSHDGRACNRATAGGMEMTGLPDLQHLNHSVSICTLPQPV